MTRIKSICSFLYILLFIYEIQAQNGPWNHPLVICESSNGKDFNNCRIFQDSSGVPSVVLWKNDTLIAAFQWFPMPFQANSSWDKVAVKFSYNGGITWRNPVSINVSGLPANFQRPFDPTLVPINNDSLRLYFSDGPKPNGPMDSSITTYSAVSTDGINYTFENGKRFISGNNLAVIDPAVINYKGTFHFQSHIGAPQDGSYHAISSDGIHFTRISDIPSDNIHNWLGNYFKSDSTLRFYGNSMNSIWYNTSSDGYSWHGYINTNLVGGDPTVVKNNAGKLYIIYVGPAYRVGLIENEISNQLSFAPNPCSDVLHLTFHNNFSPLLIQLWDMHGKNVLTKQSSANCDEYIDVTQLTSGIYSLIILNNNNIFHVKKVIINK